MAAAEKRRTARDQEHHHVVALSAAALLGQDAQRTRDMLFAGIPDLIDPRRS
jgi:hypothetical protein